MLRDIEAPDHARPVRAAEGGALDPLVQPQCSLSVQLRRATGAVIGRSAELDAISQELKEASGRLAAVTLEGEPGIGKTRLLVAAAELAVNAGFTCVAITADEEIRGPFLVARSLFASGAIRDTAAGTPAEAAVNRVVQAISAPAMHVQSEGVPFIVEELARTHRDAGTLQQVDGEWRLGRNAARLVPSAVRTLIDRRAARLPAPTRAALGDAAILGRSFSLRDLRAIRARIGGGEGAKGGDGTDGAGNGAGGDGADPLADDLEPAVHAGLLLPQAPGEP